MLLQAWRSCESELYFLEQPPSATPEVVYQWKAGKYKYKYKYNENEEDYWIDKNKEKGERQRQRTGASYVVYQ